MQQIALEGMKFFAYHGYYEEEQLIGNNYVIDVYLYTDFENAAKSDDLAETINYEEVFSICKKIMSEKMRLLETIVHKIIVEIKSNYASLRSVRVKLSKISPSMGGEIERTFVEIEKKF